MTCYNYLQTIQDSLIFNIYEAKKIN